MRLAPWTSWVVSGFALHMISLFVSLFPELTQIVIQVPRLNKRQYYTRCTSEITKNLQKIIRNPHKILPKSSQNPSKIFLKSSQNSPVDLSWALLAPSWASWRQDALENEKKPKNQSSVSPPPAYILEGFCVMLALCWAKWRSKSTWEPHLVNFYIEWGPTWANLARLDTIFKGFRRPSWHPKTNKNHYSF